MPFVNPLQSPLSPSWRSSSWDPKRFPRWPAASATATEGVSRAALRGDHAGAGGLTAPAAGTSTVEHTAVVERSRPTATRCLPRPTPRRRSQPPDRARDRGAAATASPSPAHRRRAGRAPGSGASPWVRLPPPRARGCEGGAIGARRHDGAGTEQHHRRLRRGRQHEEVPTCSALPVAHGRRVCGLRCRLSRPLSSRALPPRRRSSSAPTASCTDASPRAACCGWSGQKMKCKTDKQSIEFGAQGAQGAQGAHGRAGGAGSDRSARRGGTRWAARAGRDARRRGSVRGVAVGRVPLLARRARPARSARPARPAHRPIRRRSPTWRARWRRCRVRSAACSRLSRG